MSDFGRRVSEYATWVNTPYWVFAHSRTPKFWDCNNLIRL